MREEKKTGSERGRRGRRKKRDAYSSSSLLGGGGLQRVPSKEERKRRKKKKKKREVKTDKACDSRASVMFGCTYTSRRKLEGGHGPRLTSPLLSMEDNKMNK